LSARGFAVLLVVIRPTREIHRPTEISPRRTRREAATEVTHDGTTLVVLEASTAATTRDDDERWIPPRRRIYMDNETEAAR
jgi:hypothetical protein